MKLGPSRTRLSLRINGTRIGDSARPEATEPPEKPAPARMIRRAVPPLVIRDYRDEDDGVAS